MLNGWWGEEVEHVVEGRNGVVKGWKFIEFFAVPTSVEPCIVAAIIGEENEEGRGGGAK